LLANEQNLDIIQENRGIDIIEDDMGIDVRGER
jgi:hypothetical protein